MGISWGVMIGVMGTKHGWMGNVETKWASGISLSLYKLYTYSGMNVDGAFSICG